MRRWGCLECPARENPLAGDSCLMYNIGFTSDGDADLARLDTPIAQRVLRKLRWLAENFDVIKSRFSHAGNHPCHNTPANQLPAQDGEVYLPMNKTRMMYFEEDDVLHLAISDEPEAGSVELGPNITVELNDQGEMIGIEILEASRFIRDSIMESVQARVLRVPEFQPA